MAQSYFHRRLSDTTNVVVWGSWALRHYECSSLSAAKSQTLSTWATEAVGFVNGLAWPGLAGRLLQTLISITLQNLSWTSSFCRHRIALSSPIRIGSFQHYTSNSLSSQTLTNFMNLILSWLPAHRHYKCNSLSSRALTWTTHIILSSLPNSQPLRM